MKIDTKLLLTFVHYSLEVIVVKFDAHRDKYNVGCFDCYTFVSRPFVPFDSNIVKYQLNELCLQEFRIDKRNEKNVKTFVSL